eukprot:312598_1
MNNTKQGNNNEKKYHQKIKALKHELEKEKKMRLNANQKLALVEKIIGRKLEVVGVKLGTISQAEAKEIENQLKLQDKLELSKALKKVEELNWLKKILANELEFVKKELSQTRTKNEEEAIQQSKSQTPNDELNKQIAILMEENEQLKANQIQASMQLQSAKIKARNKLSKVTKKK